MPYDKGVRQDVERKSDRFYVVHRSVKHTAAGGKVRYYVVPLLFIGCLSFLFAQGATAHIEVSGWLPGQPKEARLATSSFQKRTLVARQRGHLIVESCIQSTQFQGSVADGDGEMPQHHLGRAIFLCSISKACTMRLWVRRNTNNRSFRSSQDGRREV